MSLLLVAALLGGAFVVWKIAGFGDALHGWAEEWRRLRSWQRRRTNRNSAYLVAVVAVLAVWLFVAYAPAREVGVFGGLSLSKLVWTLVRLSTRLWFPIALVLAALAIVHQRKQRKQYMGGEPGDPRGLARAAARSLVATAVYMSLPALKGKGSDDGKVPSVGAVTYVSAKLGDRQFEYGMRVRLHMRRGFTPKSLRGFTSDGMAPEDDQFATYVSSHLRELIGEKTTEARQVMAYAGRVPVFPFSTISYVYTDRGAVDPSQCDLLLMHRNPLTETFHYPTVRPVVANLGRPLLVGADINAAPVHMSIRERMTGIYGQNASGKSFYELNLMIGASQCQHVAFVIIDMKGPQGDLMSMAPRAAATATNHDEATAALSWLVGEMDRRAALVGEHVGKITKFSAELPEILVWADEWHEWAYAIPDAEAGAQRLRDFERLVRRARAFGIYVVAATQIVHAKDVPTSITGQFHNIVSTRLGKREHTDMVFAGELPSKVGPHMIPPDWRGVAYGRFDKPVIDMMRSLLSGPAVAAKWAKADVKAGLRVELPGLARTLAAVRDRTLVAATVVGESTTSSPPAVDAWVVADLDEPVRQALVACCAVLDQDVPETVTRRALQDLGTKANRKVQNRKGATEAEKTEMAEHREAIRQHTNPET